MASFTTWTALRDKLRDDFMRNLHARKSYTCGETTISFRDFSDFQAMLDYVERRAASESSSRPVRRTYAGMGRA